MAEPQIESPRFARSGGYSSGVSEVDRITQNMSPEEQDAARKAAQFGWGPLAPASIHSPNLYPSTYPRSTTTTIGGTAQPAAPVAASEHRNFGNPSPLGLSAFALTTFLASLVNLGTRHIDLPAIVIGPALAYGGLVQLLCGMWELVLGNTFSATALSSFAGFWIGLAIILTPGGFQIAATYRGSGNTDGFQQALALYFFAWMVFTFFLLLGTIRTNAAYFSFFLLLDLTFLFLACAYQNANNQTGAPHTGLLRAGGAFGILTAFLCWYNALAGLLDTNNSFFTLPVFEFPWSASNEQQKQRTGTKG